MSATDATPTAGVARESQSLETVFQDYRARIRGGDVGALPALAGVISLVVVFAILSGDSFTNAYNFANLIVQLLLCAGLSANLLGDQEHAALLALGICGGGQSGCATAENNHVVHNPF